MRINDDDDDVLSAAKRYLRRRGILNQRADGAIEATESCMHYERHLKHLNTAIK